MAIVQVECFLAECDGCGNTDGEDDNCPWHFQTVEETVVNDGWQVMDDGRVLCDECVAKEEMDDEEVALGEVHAPS